jgi:hypothetical protein
LLWDLVDADHHRVMLPTLTGSSSYDNNYADNPFLTCLGYTGAFWSHWREREEIMRRVKDGGGQSAPHLATSRPPGSPPRAGWGSLGIRGGQALAWGSGRRRSARRRLPCRSPRARRCRRAAE